MAVGEEISKWCQNTHRRASDKIQLGRSFFVISVLRLEAGGGGG